MSGLRRFKLVGFLWCALAVLVTGCGANQTQSGPPAAATADAGKAASESGKSDADSQQPATRTYKDATGKDIVIPADPKNMVAIQYMGDLLALGIKPVATTAYDIRTYPSELAGVGNLGDRPINTEKLLGYKPDLIITDDLDDAKEIDQLKKVAPTVALTFWLKEPFAHLSMLAEALGKQDAAKAWLAQYDEAVKATKEQLKPVVKEGDTALLLIVADKDIGVSGIRNGGYTLYRQLGFATPKKLQPLLDKDENFGFETISLESIPDFAPDHIFIEMDNDSEATKETIRNLQASGVWKNLAATKNNHVYEVSNKWGLGDATSMKQQLDEIVAKMKK